MRWFKYGIWASWVCRFRIWRVLGSKKRRRSCFMHQSGPHTYLYGVEIMNLENTYITTWNPGMHFYNDMEQILLSKKSMLLTFLRCSGSAKIWLLNYVTIMLFFRYGQCGTQKNNFPGVRQFVPNTYRWFLTMCFLRYRLVWPKLGRPDLMMELYVDS